jgi:quercetin dioxygenase-like cupin family protein
VIRSSFHTLLAAAAMIATTSGATGVAAGQERVSPAFSQAISNIPGKSLTAVIVDYPPGAKSPSHRHATSAFIFAYVVSGEIRSAVDGGAPKVFRTGESWAELPGAHHTVSENASRTRPAKLLAVFVLDTKAQDLVRPDPEARP